MATNDRSIWDHGRSSLGGGHIRTNMIGSTAAEAVIYDPNAGRISGWDVQLTRRCIHRRSKIVRQGQHWLQRALSLRSDPTGDFLFSVGKLIFHSNDIDLLIVTGNEADLKGTGSGTGSINGHHFAFVVTIIDGSRTPAADEIRIMIWDPISGNVLYDNQPSAADNDDPMARLASGDTLILR